MAPGRRQVMAAARVPSDSAASSAASDRAATAGLGQHARLMQRRQNARVERVARAHRIGHRHRRCRDKAVLRGGYGRAPRARLR